MFRKQAVMFWGFVGCNKKRVYHVCKSESMSGQKCVIINNVRRMTTRVPMSGRRAGKPGTTDLSLM